MRNNSSIRRGFTLVEMSIVLVIIGLIIGGILKGQEVIASARQKAVINQVNAVRAATNSYFDRYRAMPGDDPTAGSVIDGALNNGDGSGIVGATGTNTGDLVSGTVTSATNTENYGFFNGLVATGLLNGGQVTTGVPATVQFGTSALPAAPVTGAGLSVAYGLHDGGGNNKKAHWLRMHKGIGTLAAAISPRTAQNIDAAIDDGVPDNGGVRGDDGGSTAGCNAAGATAKYAVSDNTICIPLFEISQ